MSTGLTDPFGRQLSARPTSAVATSPSADDTAVPSGPALDDPATRTAFRRYRRRGGYVASVGATLFAAFLVVVTLQAQHAKWLLEHGSRVPGVITSVSRNVHGGGSFGVAYDADGRSIRGSITLTESSGYYAPGETVTVIYDPQHPSDIRTAGETNEPSATVTPLVLALVAGLIMLVGGIGTLVRARRVRRLLSTSPWRTYRARYLARVVRKRFQPLNPGLEVTPVGGSASSSALLRLASTWRWRTERMRKYDGQTVWVAGDPAGRAIIGIPATRELLIAKRPKASIAGDYQRAASETPTRDPVQIKKARGRLRAILVAQWALFSAAIIWRTGGSSLGLAIAVLYGLSLVVVLISLARAPLKTDDKSST